MNNQPQNINLDTINDVTELKALKSDQYEILQDAQNTVERTQANLRNINLRIAQIEMANKQAADKVANEHAEANTTPQQPARTPKQPKA